MRNRTRLSFFFVLVIGVVAATGWIAAHGPDESAASVPQQYVGAPDGQLPDGFRTAAGRAQPGVVYIQVESPAPQRSGRGRQGRGPTGPRLSAGSGIVFRADGYVLTNNHVIETAQRITVTLPDRRQFLATLVGRDPNTDVAVIKIEADELVPVPFGDSDEVQVGDWVMALGYPLALGATATAGIVSAKGRSINILQPQNRLESFIQTDAAINQGNSGGPLIDLNGNVVGMSSAIASQTGFYEGYGFAVPINLVSRVAEDLIEFGEARRPQLGVRISTVDDADARVYNLDRVVGVEVSNVTAGGPADRAGIQLGDVVVSVDGRPIETDGELMEYVARYHPGERVTMGLIRYGEPVEVAVELGVFPPGAPAGNNAEPVERDVHGIGFAVAPPDSAQVALLNLSDPRGIVVVDSLQPNTEAANWLQNGIIIESVNRVAIADQADFDRVTGDLGAGSVVSLVVRDASGERFMVNYIVR